MTHSTAEGFSVTARFKVIQEKALELCRGRVLDVGAGVGRDALVLKQSGLDVLAVDSEPRCVDIMHHRGLSTAVCASVYNLDDSHFDTIIVMQMTIGLSGNLEGLVELLARLSQLMSPDGQILLDSMAPGYLARSPYYPGQRQIELYYGRYVGAATSWLYVDYDVLQTCAKQVSLDAELISRGSSSLDYLARLFKVRNERLAK
jgi:2-polyprenyl-3-methyl-5-hydroxy-6-metoxy-1,4-benzoquinol methylase